MLKYVFPFVVTTLSAAGATFDPPDLTFEAQLHRDYIRSEQAVPSANSQTQGLMESYRLQKGENLWGLSEMLYGDGNYWPRVWAQNQEITNPHLIRKGHTLQLLMGSEDDAPAFRFSESEDTGLELAAVTTSNPQIDIPDPEIAPRPVLRVPPSFPEYQRAFREVHDNFNQVDDSRIAFQRRRVPDRIPLSAYVQDQELDSSGEFLEPERESGLPVAMQYVYVKIKKATAHIGQRLLIVEDRGVIRKMNDQVDGKMTARFIQVYGDIELTSQAVPSFTSSSDKKNFDVYRALILHATNLTHSHYQLVPGELQVVDMTRNGPSGTAVAQVIGSAKAETSALYGIGDIVFLNKGTKDGVEVGQIMDLYIDRTIRDSSTPVKYSSVSSGMLKIARTSDTCSTAVILSAIDSIQQGDRAQQHGAPAVLAPTTADDSAPTNDSDDSSDLPVEGADSE